MGDKESGCDLGKDEPAAKRPRKLEELDGGSLGADEMPSDNFGADQAGQSETAGGAPGGNLGADDLALPSEPGAGSNFGTDQAGQSEPAGGTPRGDIGAADEPGRQDRQLGP